MGRLRLFIAIISFTICVTSPLYGIEAPLGWQEERSYVERKPKPPAKKMDISSGLISYTRNYMDPIYMESRPQDEEISDVFRVTLARGEYEPFIVSLYGLKDLDNISIKIENVRAGKDEILMNQFEVRKIESRAVLPKGRKIGAKRYQLIPSLLRITNSSDLKRGQTTAFWITVHALKENVPGNYEGQIVISNRGKAIRNLKLEIRVLPFVLEEIPDRVFATLYTPTNLPSRMERNARILLKDMRAHGMTSYSPTASAWGKPLSFDEKGRPKISTLLNHLRWAKEEGFWAPTILNIQKLIRAGRPNLDANYTKFDESLDIPNLKKLVLYLETERKKHNCPEIIYLPIDEPGSFTDQAGTKREEMAVLLLKTLCELNVRGATTVDSLVDNKHRRLPRWKNVVGWWEKIKPYCTVRIYHNGYTEGKTSLENEMKDAKMRGHDVMLYENTSTMGIDPRVSRMYFGFYGWRTGVRGITSWTHPTFDKATIHHVWTDRKERKRDRLQYYRDLNWELPPTTVCWEMVREGIDDAKYLQIFQKLLERHKLVKPKYSDLIEELKSVVDSTKMSEKKPRCDWSGERFSAYRQRFIEAILELRGSKGL
jgi:hypothetical protein